jgi:hypothetical protein
MRVEIMFTDITKLTTRTRFEESLVTTIQFDTKLQPAHIARILNLQRQGAPLLVTIGSPQAAMDLSIQEDKEEAEPAAQSTLFSEGK